MADHSGGPGADPASSPFGNGDRATTFPGKLDVLERVDLGEGIKRGSASVDDSRTNHALRWVLVPRHVGPSILLLGQLKVANSAVSVLGFDVDIASLSHTFLELVQRISVRLRPFVRLPLPLDSCVSEDVQGTSP